MLGVILCLLVWFSLYRRTLPKVNEGENLASLFTVFLVPRIEPDEEKLILMASKPR